MEKTFFFCSMRVKIKRKYKLYPLEGKVIRKDKMGNFILSETVSEDRVIQGLVYVKGSSIIRIEELG